MEAENIKIGSIVRSVRKEKSTGKPVVMFEGVVVNIKPNIIWGFNLVVQNVTPNPLYDRGEMIDCKADQVELREYITTNYYGIGLKGH